MYRPDGPGSPTLLRRRPIGTGAARSPAGTAERLAVGPAGPGSGAARRRLGAGAARCSAPGWLAHRSARRAGAAEGDDRLVRARVWPGRVIPAGEPVDDLR